MKKTTQLKNILTSKELGFLMEAHSGLSAKIVEEAGFQGIWGSGLSISASLGVRDNNEASWTQVLDVCEYMSDATSIPILLDGDTGYGNFNNMRRLVKKLEQRGVAGVCIEDKIFPKTNSFLRGEAQPLADIEEFSGKIKAGLDARLDEDFCVVARVEAFIAGHGLKAALERAEAYRQAGASAILMHSKISRPDEIISFMKEWGNRCPVVIVPTKYYSTPTDEFRKQGISTVIWANHLVRSSITAMQQTAQTISEQESLINVEDKVASVKEIFRLQNDQELVEAEKKYFQQAPKKNAIILAASRGEELGELTLERPKTLLKVNGRTLLEEMIDKMHEHSPCEVTVVRGYKKESFPDYSCKYVDNNDFDQTGELASLAAAQDDIKGDVIISYGDILYRSFILDALEHDKNDISLIVDSSTQGRSKFYRGDYVECTRENTGPIFEGETHLKKIELTTKDQAQFDLHGEWIGLVRATPRGSELIKETLQEMAREQSFQKEKMAELLRCLMRKDIKIGVQYIQGHWMDIDNYQDFENIQVF